VFVVLVTTSLNAWSSTVSDSDVTTTVSVNSYSPFRSSIRSSPFWDSGFDRIRKSEVTLSPRLEAEKPPSARMTTQAMTVFHGLREVQRARPAVEKSDMATASENCSHRSPDRFSTP
jgi:hypothetical protein